MAVRNREYDLQYNREWHQNNKASVKVRHSEWRQNNKEERNAYMREWWKAAKLKDPEKYTRQRRQHSLKRKYGISLDDYENLLAKQGGHCALCDKKPSDERYGSLHVDHCHKTGRVRGLLCTNHNTALGTLGDDVEGLHRAINYLNGGV